jgi:hypothetical protein
MMCLIYGAPNDGAAARIWEKNEIHTDNKKISFALPEAIKYRTGN